MILFFALLSVVFILVIALSWYALGAVVSPSRLAGTRGGLMLLDMATVAVMIFGRSLFHGHDEAERISYIIIAMIWMAQFLFGLIVALIRLARWAYYRSASRTDDVADPDKRRLLKGAMIYPIVAAGASLYGGTAGRIETVVREMDVPVGEIGDDLENYRIAQISDVHLGKFFSLDDLRDLMEKAAGTKADVLALTGDIFDDNEMNERAVSLIGEYTERFPDGIWFCYGNHEYFRDVERTNRALINTKIHVLKNDHIRLKKGKRPFYIVGVDYPRPRSAFEEKEKRCARDAFEGIPKNAVTVLLAHHPDFIDDAAEHDATLVLTGHTHGGQLGLMGVPLVPPVFKYMRGVYRVGDTVGYVHSGNGSWFPWRLGCPPEIAVFRFVKG